MSPLDLKRSIFYTPEEVADLFRREGNLPWVYRHARPGGFLHPAARKFGRQLLFSRDVIEKLIGD